MSLADKVMEMEGGKFDRMMFGAFTAAKSKISAAQRFVFSPDTMHACHQLTRSRPSALLEAMPMCRAPFKTVWMEWGGNVLDRPLKDKELDYVAPIALPERFGCLIECLDDTNRRFGASFFWNFARGESPTPTSAERVVACPLGVIVNWYDDWQPMNRLQALRGPINLEKEIKPSWHAAKFLHDQKERDALLRIGQKVASAVPPHMVKFVTEVKKNASFETTEAFMKSSENDITGEIAIVQAALCLLNSKNCVTVEVADLKAINARRRKECKKPLLSYSRVTISLSRADQRVVSSGAVSAEEIRRHVVRGHFKLRKSGVYWWRPFIRGSSKAGQVVRTGYEVVA